jgi:hypothetical protein
VFDTCLLHNYRWLQKETVTNGFEYGIEMPEQRIAHLNMLSSLLHILLAGLVDTLDLARRGEVNFTPASCS